MSVFTGDNYMFLVDRVSGLVENFYTGIFSDNINVINVKLYMMVPHLEEYLFTLHQLTNCLLHFQ